MNIRSFHVLAGASISAISLAAAAHHSVEGSFDIANPVTLSGVVDEVVWANPHAYVLISSTAEGGAAERWAVELGAPNSLVQAGFDRSSIAVGDELTATVFALRPGVDASAYVSGSASSELALSLAAVVEQATVGRLAHADTIRLSDGRTFESIGAWMRTIQQ